ncbi:MAG: fibrobacter succinogenes major paralogous domain-containing protein, partial [Prevotella sp.]|nr:fibrobacter succinogenes major paralogous domain-containing protein [Prevotella sp.]
VTFENGRQYVLNLTFGAGSGSGGTDPDINIGAKISFEDIDVDPYPDKDIQVPPQPPYWAASNIYFLPGDGEGGTFDTGVLTFAESGTGKEGYQGVYFKWGSLIGVSEVGNDAFDGDSYLFVPDLSTGTYTRVKVKDVTGSEDYFTGITGSWDIAGGADAWAMIAYADESVIDAPVDDRNDARLTTDQDWTTLAGDYTDYTGDICKFLSKHKGTSGGGLTKDWVMPVSKNFGEPTENDEYTDPGSVYSKAGSGITAGNVNGIGGTLWGVNLSYALNAPVFFPASGFRPSDGYLNYAGSTGYYWSSSPTDANAYCLGFNNSYVYPAYANARTNGLSVRCVRE